MDEKKIPLLDVKFDGNAKKTEINVNKIFFKVLSDVSFFIPIAPS